MSHTGGTWRAVIDRDLKGTERNAIVSDDPSDATYPEEGKDYGGTLIGEAILPKNMQLLLLAPELLAAVRRAKHMLDVFVVVHPEEHAIKSEADALTDLLARADKPTPSAPPWP